MACLLLNVVWGGQIQFRASPDYHDLMLVVTCLSWIYFLTLIETFGLDMKTRFDDDANVLHKQLTKKRRHQCCQLFLEKIGLYCHFPKSRSSNSHAHFWVQIAYLLSKCPIVLNHIFLFIFRYKLQNDKVGNTWMGERSETSGMEQSKEESWLL